MIVVSIIVEKTYGIFWHCATSQYFLFGQSVPSALSQTFSAWKKRFAGQKFGTMRLYSSEKNFRRKIIFKTAPFWCFRLSKKWFSLNQTLSGPPTWAVSGLLFHKSADWKLKFWHLQCLLLFAEEKNQLLLPVKLAWDGRTPGEVWEAEWKCWSWHCGRASNLEHPTQLSHFCYKLMKVWKIEFVYPSFRCVSSLPRTSSLFPCKREMLWTFAQNAWETQAT